MRISTLATIILGLAGNLSAQHLVIYDPFGPGFVDFAAPSLIFPAPSPPLFVYPAVEGLARPEVAAFFQFYLDNTNALSAEVGYVPLPDDILQQSKDALAAAGGS